jgi:hypothetical protein
VSATGVLGVDVVQDVTGKGFIVFRKFRNGKLLV